MTRVHVSIAIYRRESDGARRNFASRTSFQLTRLPQFGMQKPQFAALVGNPRPHRSRLAALQRVAISARSTPPSERPRCGGRGSWSWHYRGPRPQCPHAGCRRSRHSADRSRTSPRPHPRIGAKRKFRPPGLHPQAQQSACKGLRRGDRFSSAGHDAPRFFLQ